MPTAIDAGAIASALRATADAGRAVVVAGVGSGATARGAVEGGADVLAAYNTAVYRLQNLPTPLAFLPYDDANELTLAAAPEVLANAGDRPVILGFGAHDPRRCLDDLIDRAVALGAAGITNEPFIGVYEPEMQRQLEAAGYGFSREVTLVRKAVERDLLAMAWAFDEAGIRAMIDAGAQIVGVMLGLSGGGDEARETAALDRLEQLCEAAAATNPNTLVVVHGGPLGNPEVVGSALQRCRAHGYVTGSSAERQPVIAGVARAVQEFKHLRLGSHAGAG